MRYVFAALLSFSVMAVEELQQAETIVSGQQKHIVVIDTNTTQGGEVKGGKLFEIRTAWSGLNWSGGSLSQVDTAGATISAIPTPFNGSDYSSALYMSFQSWNGQQTLTLDQTAIANRVNAIIATPPSHGTLTVSDATPSAMSGPEFAYTPTAQYVGEDSFVISYQTQFGSSPFCNVTVSISIVNTPPSVSLSASPALTLPGSEVAFTATTSDANGHAVSVVFDYGDGSTGSAATHTYSAPGVYAVTATASDGFGGTTTAQTTVTVVGADHVPTARFTTSDVVAFVNVPFTVDATTSTDPQNGQLAAKWNFGDGTPQGSGTVLSHVYASAGVVTVGLTVTDAEGFSHTITRDIEVLEEAAAATFDSEVRVSTTYFPLKTNRDVIQVFARVNIGDTQLGDGTAVALEYAGKRYTTTLNKRGKAVGWTVKQNLRRQTPGTVEVTFKARNTAIASLLSALGAVNDADIDVPFRLELGSKIIQVDVPTLFDVGLARGTGKGELE